MINVTLLDGDIVQYNSPVSCLEVVNQISKSLAKRVLVAKVDGELCDLSHELTHSCNIEFLTIDREDSCTLNIIRHDAAHLLAQAVKELFSDVKVVIGPTIENGFYYDFARSIPFSTADLSIIEDKMLKLSTLDCAIVRQELTKEEAIAYFTKLNEHYKVELIKELDDEQIISIYKQGNFCDLCRGPHAISTRFVKHFKLLKVSGSYWRGDSKNANLQRIYGTAWLTKDSLNNYMQQISDAEKNDHRRIGREMDLFHQQNEASGDVFWHPKGRTLYLIIEDYMRRMLSKEDYYEVKTPQLLRRAMWIKSGHWEKFHEHMFTIEADDVYALKPMNCPGHVQIFNSCMRSYRDLPLKMAEFGCCHRYEPSGALYGLMRVRAFTQDDAHIFCTKEQITSETISFCKLLHEVYLHFGFDKILIKFSDRPKTRSGSDDVWDEAEKSLLEAIIKAGHHDYILNSGEGAFYGPKLEFVLRDALGRDWQCGTLQVDFVLPERLGATYIDANGKKKHPVMLHRAILGSMERFIGVLIEHYAGRFPVWLAPVQVVVCSIASNHDEVVKSILQKLTALRIRAICDVNRETIGYKVRKYSNDKIPIIIVVGDDEVKNNTVTVRRFGKKGTSVSSLDDFLKEILAESKAPDQY